MDWSPTTLAMGLGWFERDSQPSPYKNVMKCDGVPVADNEDNLFR